LREHGGIVTERRSLNSDVGTHVTVPGVDCLPPRKNWKLTAHSRPVLSSRETRISTEIELKLAARTADLPALRRALAAMAKGKKTTRAKLVSTYYDTDDRAHTIDENDLLPRAVLAGEVAIHRRLAHHSDPWLLIDAIGFGLNGSQTNKNNITTNHYFFETFNFFEKGKRNHPESTKFLCFDAYGEKINVRSLLDLQVAFFENISQLK